MGDCGMQVLSLLVFGLTALSFAVAVAVAVVVAVVAVAVVFSLSAIPPLARAQTLQHNTPAHSQTRQSAPPIVFFLREHSHALTRTKIHQSFHLPSLFIPFIPFPPHSSLALPSLTPNTFDLLATTVSYLKRQAIHCTILIYHQVAETFISTIQRSFKFEHIKKNTSAVAVIRCV
ncbi:hypothetical protein GQ42DRAFT_88961 [Ramicandelaber brevisporus]|nr:hypothetical protein GQ42DRAFT_88961 [Ramicandelaber brevisporus]